MDYSEHPSSEVGSNYQRALNFIKVFISIIFPLTGYYAYYLGCRMLAEEHTKTVLDSVNNPRIPTSHLYELQSYLGFALCFTYIVLMLAFWHKKIIE